MLLLYRLNIEKYKKKLAKKNRSKTKKKMAKSSTNEGGSNEVDRISGLPDSIIHQILSPFHMKDVVQTSILSKRWRYVWKSHPFLNFNSDLLFPDEKYIFPTFWYFDSEYEQHFFSERGRKCIGFLDFVDKVILFRDNSCNIQSFNLHHRHPSPESYNFKIWILIALRSNVEDLCLNYLNPEFFNQLPHEYLFTCKSLTKLELRNRRLDITLLNLPDSINLPNLKSLFLQGFRFEYSGTVANNIFSSSCFPVLESLILLGCAFPKTSGIHISALQLKHLEIINYLFAYFVNVDWGGDEYPIKLCTPNLIKFVCKDRLLSRDYSIEDLPAVVEAEIGLGTDEVERDTVPDFDDIEDGRLYSQRMMKFLRVVQNVETLTLRAPFVKAMSGDNAILESISIQFSKLKCLKLETWLSIECMNSITYLLNISPNIEFLSLDITRADRKGNTLSIDSVMDKVYWEAGLSLHRLKGIEIKGDAIGDEDELRFLEILLKKALVLESVTLYTPRKNKQARDYIKITKEMREEIDKELRALPRVASSTKFTVV